MALLPADYNTAYNNLPTPTPMSGSTKDVWPDGVDDLSAEIELPSFNFDWALDKEAKSKTGPEAATELMSSLSIKSVASGSVSPPPSSSTPPPRHSHSARSSLSSAHITSLTDASTASASSLVPTPPGSGISQSGRSMSSQNIDSGGSGSSGRMYGGRRFQRVVSAPLSRPKPEVDDLTSSTGETSTMSASTSHTATLRPTITHTSSSSSIPSESTATSRSHFVTPGITDRTLSSVRSTGRRLGGLSKFGGPARRVVASAENEEVDEVQRASPVLIESPPPRESSPAQPSSSSSPPREAYTDYRSRRVSPPRQRSILRTTIREESEAPVPIPEYRRPEPRATSPNPPSDDKPFRPFNRRPEQEARPPPHTLETMVVRPERYSKPISRRSPSPPQARISPPAVTLHAARPAPAVESRAPPPPQPSTVYAATAPVYAAPEPSAPLQAVNQTPPTRSSFLVNGVPYERLQRLGKGGSSTVYSVLYSAPPKKRTIFALKVVQLDRADSETYQSYTNEIELLKRLRGHDRVIQLIDHQITFSQPNRPHRLLMVMECGEIDFAALLDEQRGKAINMNFVGLYWEQMLEAVQAVHKENVVHTDLKPANFVLVKGRLKIIDFGIAKAVANDTVNIQRDQQIGTVNYMSPEAIQRMNNQKVLKLSYPSDIWSLGCILYQMIYGAPPFQHIGGGPLAKMGVIADPNHSIMYPEIAIPKTAVGVGLDGQPIDPATLAVAVSPAAIDSMKRCLAYRKEHRLTIPELLHHEFLKPKIRAPDVPPGSTPITQYQMERLVNFILCENGLPELPDGNHTAEDLFSQLQAQNSLS
nr:uncharacterized protein CI109_002261 [Kwoniella shandongensis]KAA5529368.1 hypothetical protein CI109_002261 [Kwoniella shandongensis]